MLPEQVPVVLVPRSTTLAGAIGGSDGFTTVALDVTAFSRAVVTVWRGVVIGDPPPPMTDPFEIVFEESTDRVTWATCAGSPVIQPVENVQLGCTVTLAKRWFRVRIVLAQANNVASCWVAGFLEKRMT